MSPRSAPGSTVLGKEQAVLHFASCYPQARSQAPPLLPTRPQAHSPGLGTWSETRDPSDPKTLGPPGHTPLAPQLGGDLGTRWGGDVPRRGVGKRRLFHLILPEVQPLDRLQPGPLDPGSWGNTQSGKKQVLPLPSSHPGGGLDGRTEEESVPLCVGGQLPPPGTPAVPCGSTWRTGRRSVLSSKGLLERRPDPVPAG